MKASELIEELKQIIEEEGDLDVAVRNEYNGTFTECTTVRRGLRAPRLDNIVLE